MGPDHFRHQRLRRVPSLDHVALELQSVKLALRTLDIAVNNPHALLDAVDKGLHLHRKGLVRRNHAHVLRLNGR
jgi:hypothetical protein